MATNIKKIEIDAARMIDGLFELFDDLADLALNRVVSHTRELESGFNSLVVDQQNVDRFKITWFVTMGELMFREMGGATMAPLMDRFYGEMRYLADRRDSLLFLEEITEKVKKAIADDEPFINEGTFNTVTDGNGSGSTNLGLGADLAALLTDISFAGNTELVPVYKNVKKTIEDEFINAYGHSSIACARFEVIV